jgi:inhibitor of cysteine peptidase
MSVKPFLAATLLLTALLSGLTALAAPPATAPAPAAAPAPATALAVTEADNGKTLKLGTAATTTISLAGNATTGFSWAVSKVEGDALQQVGDIQYTPQRAPAGMVGTGGTSTVTFRAVKPGQTTISLAYARPWERGTPPAQTFKVTLVVDQAPATAPATAPTSKPATTTAPILMK